MSYPSDFDEELREKVRRRDGYMCVVCGKTEAESLADYGQVLSVHHKDEDKSNSNINNLVTVCKGCHQRTHWNHDVIV